MAEHSGRIARCAGRRVELETGGAECGGVSVGYEMYVPPNQLIATPLHARGDWVKP